MPFQKSWAASKYQESSPPILTFGSKVSPISRALSATTTSKNTRQCCAITGESLSGEGEVGDGVEELRAPLGITLAYSTDKGIGISAVVEVYFTKVCFIATHVLA